MEINTKGCCNQNDWGDVSSDSSESSDSSTKSEYNLIEDKCFQALKWKVGVSQSKYHA